MATFFFFHFHVSFLSSACNRELLPRPLCSHRRARQSWATAVKRGAERRPERRPLTLRGQAVKPPLLKKYWKWIHDIICNLFVCNCMNVFICVIQLKILLLWQHHTIDHCKHIYIVVNVLKTNTSKIIYADTCNSHYYYFIILLFYCKRRQLDKVCL